MKNMIQNTWRFFSLPLNMATMEIMGRTISLVHQELGEAIRTDCKDACRELVMSQKYPPLSKKDFFNNGDSFKKYCIKCFQIGQNCNKG